MNYRTTHSFHREPSPKPIKNLIIIISIISLLSALFDNLAVHLWGFPGPQRLLSISSYGLQNIFLWQPLTYMFIQPTLHGISLGFILNLFFDMMILLLAGSEILKKFGTKSFFRMFFSIGIISGIAAYVTIYAIGSNSFIAGCTPPIYALLIAWAMIFPEQEIMLFMTLPVKIKWLVVGLFCMHLLIDVSQINIVHLITITTGMVSGYIYALIAWNLHGPFAATKSFENGIVACASKLRPLFYKETARNKQVHKHAKVFDFKTGKPIIDDDEFMDTMLAKISLHGEAKLASGERKRMKRISEQKTKESHVKNHCGDS